MASVEVKTIPLEMIHPAFPGCSNSLPSLPSNFPVDRLGAIERCVKKTLTKRRMSRLEKRPLTGSEFLNSLALEASKTAAARSEDTKNMNDFTCMITGLDDRMKMLQELNNPDEGDDKKGKKKK